MRKRGELAREKLEDAVATLLNRATGYQGIIVGSSGDTVWLLRAAREYARAFRRVETLRRG